MKKAEVIKELAGKDCKDNPRLVYLLLLSLTDEELIGLYFEYLSDKFLRNISRRHLKRRVSEADGKGFGEFFSRLFNEYKKGDGRKRASLGAILMDFGPSLPGRLLNEIVRFCANSDLPSDRHRAYNFAYSVWNQEVQNILLSSFNKYRDIDCLLVLFEHADLDLVSCFFEEFWYDDALDLYESDKYRFLKRLAMNRVYVFGKLEQTHPTSYLYALAVGGYDVSDNQASELFDRAENEGKRDLALWSLAQMKKWEVLTKKLNLDRRGGLKRIKAK